MITDPFDAIDDPENDDTELSDDDDDELEGLTKIKKIIKKLNLLKMKIVIPKMKMKTMKLTMMMMMMTPTNPMKVLIPKMII